MNMTFDMLPINTRVVVIKNCDNVNLIGSIGRIIGHLPLRNRVEIEFEKTHPDITDLHSCGGKCKYGYGWTMELNCVLPIVECDTDFKPASPSDVCDFTGEQADYRIGSLKFKKEYAGLVKKCDQCGEYHYLSDLANDGDKYFCKKCIEENGWHICDDCGYVIKSYELRRYVNRRYDDERVVCPDCAVNYTECMHCGELVSNNHVSLRGSNGSVCGCCEENYTTCVDCGDIVEICNDNLYCGSYYCTVHNPSKVAIHNYSFKPNPTFFGEGDLYMGVELEVDEGYHPKDAANSIKSDRVYCKRDGSLGNNGIEIVTHPCTLEYHTDSFGWNKIINSMLEYDYRSHDTDTCGLHIHVNKDFFGDYEQDKDYNISKILILSQRFWDKLVTFSRRRYGALDRWAKKSEIDFKKDDTKSTLARKVRDERYEDDRYKAVNLQNSNTIEFRLFRGTLKLDTLIATLQFVDGLCRYAKKNEFDTVYSVSWKDFVSDEVFNYPELRRYLAERNLD